MPPFLDFMGLDAPVRYIAWEYLKALALGLILFVVARVMAWGAEVHDDASRFV